MLEEVAGSQGTEEVPVATLGEWPLSRASGRAVGLVRAMLARLGCAATVWVEEFPGGWERRSADGAKEGSLRTSPYIPLQALTILPIDS